MISPVVQIFKNLRLYPRETSGKSLKENSRQFPKKKQGTTEDDTSDN